MSNNKKCKRVSSHKKCKRELSDKTSDKDYQLVQKIGGSNLNLNLETIG